MGQPTPAPRRRARALTCIAAVGGLLVAGTIPAIADPSDGDGFLGTASDLGVDIPEGETVIVDGVVSGAIPSSATGRWFIELDATPTAAGGSQNRVTSQQDAFLSDAAALDIDVESEYKYSTLWSGLSVTVDDADVAALTELDGVVAAQPVYEVAAPDPQQGQTPELYSALTMTGADIVQSELEFDGTGVKVGIIDTGVDFDHPDFGGSGTDGGTEFPTERVAFGYDFVGDSFNADPSDPAYQPNPNPDRNPDDCGGHGTHVAGIVGADGDIADGGVRGVAPGVTLGAYRVFGCEGSTTTDVMIAAMERALADGMDVVNQSIGSAFSTWPQYPTAVAADNLVDAGVVMVASIGNSGANGTWSAGAPGVGEDVIGVASFDNTDYMASTFTISPDGSTVPYTEASDGAWDEIPAGESIALTRLGAPGTPEAQACSAISEDLSGTAALIQRGACSFYDKALAAQTAGADAVVLYNNAPGLLSPTVGGEVPITIPVVMISAADGAVVDSRLAADGVDLTWVGGLVQLPNPTGGLISDFSSYGMTADLQLKPDLGAPGGSIYSTYPLEEGEYASLSGTSMSAPHVAGAAALYLEAKPDTAAQDMRDILQNTAEPAPFSLLPDSGFLEPVHRQGAGMIQIDDAILATTSVTPGKLSLGEVDADGVSATVTVTNDGDAPVTYDVSVDDGISTEGSPDDPGFFADVAEVDAPEQVTVPAGGSVDVEVTIAPDPESDLAQFGGWVVMTSEDDDVATLRVPFAGFSGDYQALRSILSDGDDAIFPMLGKIADCDRFIGVDCVANGSWDPVGPTETARYTMANGDVPTMLVHFEYPVEEMSATLLREAGPNGRMVEVGPAAVAYEQYIGRSGTPTGFSAFTWDGTLLSDPGDASTQVADGRYLLRIDTLKPLGDPSLRGHTESWTSPAFVVEAGDPQSRFLLTSELRGGAADITFRYGYPEDEVFVGDWDGDGTDTIALRDGRTFAIRNSNTSGTPDQFVTYGRAADEVFVGDWDGDGIDTFAVRRGNAFHIKNDVSAGPADRVVYFGSPGDEVLVGDWNGDGTDTFAVRRGKTFYVMNTLRTGVADRQFNYGRPGDTVLVGNWNGTGGDTFAVRRGKEYHIRNSLTGGPGQVIRYGRASDEVYAGDWNGDGKDSLGVRRAP